MSIPVFRPTIKRNDMGNVLTCMISDVIGQGPLSDELAHTMAKYLELHNGMAVSNYFNALALVIDLMELERGDNVIVSSLSPSMYLDVLNARGLNPLFADVDPDSGALLPNQVNSLTDKNPKLILLHYTLGIVPDLEQITSYGIPLIEDLSQAVGASFLEKKCGCFGDFSVMATNPESILTTGGGALILARDKKAYGKILKLRERTRDCFYMPDLNASLGLAQIKELESFINHRKEIASTFANAIMRSRHKTIIQQDDRGENIYYTFPVIIDTGMKEARKYALKRDVDTYPAFNHSIAALLDEDESLPNARNLMLRCLLFPCYPMLGRKNIELISKVLSTLP
ncbi:MAG: DegT/DnrJ/EryC1/StrS aminotransferase family protein [Spirochaetales bacterium]|nr:DegT/DnrJ/EryC1/StrS aminotransferase family protein [Spirochaetales bacterium]